MSQLKQQSKQLGDTVAIIENACPQVGVGIPDHNGSVELAADQEKPRDELQGGEEFTEHAAIDEEEPSHNKQVPLSISQLGPRFSELEQVQKQINLIATMIPTIHDGKKRSGLIKSIAPILEESLDGLLHSLRDAEDSHSTEKLTKIIMSHEQTDLDSDEAEQTSTIAALKHTATVKENPSSEGYIRRKKSVTHETQHGDAIERTKSVTHEEQGGRDDADSEIDIEDDAAGEQQTATAKKTHLKQHKTTVNVEQKVAEKKALEARLKELSLEITASEEISHTNEDW